MIDAEMSLGEEILLDWQWYSLHAVGEILPANYIAYDEEENAVQLGYQVPDGERPLEVDGRKVRCIAVYYSLDELTDTVRN